MTFSDIVTVITLPINTGRIYIRAREAKDIFLRAVSGTGDYFTIKSGTILELHDLVGPEFLYLDHNEGSGSEPTAEIIFFI